MGTLHLLKYTYLGYDIHMAHTARDKKKPPDRMSIPGKSTLSRALWSSATVQRTEPRHAASSTIHFDERLHDIRRRGWQIRSRYEYRPIHATYNPIK
jgi:hypothetical protein